MKKYKDCNPLDTINRIREILYNIGILVKEHDSGNGLSHSCRIIAGSNEMGILNLGTNGKGESFEYSLASGYAEFLERLQNNILFNKKRYASKNFISTLPKDSYYVKKLNSRELIFDYIYSKDEEVWDIVNVLDYSMKELCDLFNISSEEELHSFFIDYLKLQKTLMQPFYSVSDEDIKFLPLDLCLSMTATNGMSAGNSQNEALLQAICEIFERYSLRKIYNERITPPTIPLSFFSNTPIYEKLQALISESKYEVIIKDCSLGLSIPVIGLLIIDRERQLYNFKLGADFILHRALSRCLSELQQGAVEFRWMDYKFIDIDDFSNSKIEDIYKHNFCKLFTTGYGYWPSSIISNLDSYKFTPYNKEYAQSDENDLRISYDIIRRLGYNIYIRNNSILGFPSYYVVIPGMSNVWISKFDCNLYMPSINNLNIVNRLSNISVDEAKTLSVSLDENYCLMKYHSYNYTSNYLYNINFDLQSLDLELLLFMLFYKLEIYAKAYIYLSIFLENKNKKLFAYYFTCLDYVKFKYINNKTHEETKYFLYTLYGPELADEAIADLTSGNIFHYYDFPTCFNCESCKVASSCKFFDILEIEKRISELSAKNILSQEIDVFK